MSKIIQSVWGPAEFPEKGRLKLSRLQIENNYKLRQKEKKRLHEDINSKHQTRMLPPCCKTLYISFFFDGTNNNKHNDLDIAKPLHPTNIARLFEATYADENNTQIKEREYFKHYIPGVGTSFPEIQEYDYSGRGLAFATGGENRINWALLMFVDSLCVSAGEEKLELKVLRESLDSMKTCWPIEGKNRRRQAINTLLSKNNIAEKLQAKPKAVAVKLYIYGFSRGAAEARTFTNWLTQLFDTPENSTLPAQTLLNIPVSVEFLGILDTVPSVGIVHLAPGFTGHFDWACGTQQLPDEAVFPGFVRCCRHFIAAHEQRLCFPLDTVRRPAVKSDDGEEACYYPGIAKEVIYPGVHSDVGGGYPANDQGKAREGDAFILSQIVLHDMYSEAFKAGAPLMVIDIQDIPVNNNKPMVYPMEPKTDRLFRINPEIISRFNAWRTTLGLDNTGDAPVEYEVCDLSLSLEKAVDVQMAWMTAWRIDRYANGTYANQQFYKNIMDTSGETKQEWSADDIKNNKAEYDALMNRKKALRKRAAELGREGAGAPVYDDNGEVVMWEDENGGEVYASFTSDELAGPPVFESKRDGTQISEAATEFRHDYFDEIREHKGWYDFPVDTLLKYPMYLLNSDDERIEYEKMKQAAESIYKKRKGFPVINNETQALICALYDDQIHDSRAWFMHFELGTREPWAGYFRYRMIYAGSETNKSLTLISYAGQLVGIATLTGGIIYTVKQRNLKGILGGVAGTWGALALEYQVVDIATGIALPFMDNAPELLQPSTDHSFVAQATQAQALFNNTQGIIDNLTNIINPDSILKIA
ncbi:DUF2235 domain-containing protein [Morganella psychrotolerans]|uniref:DUF2235 domain-containing protein n=2 Tax=Morganella psychrotolerans TaxID=368603 RepID=A0A5M9QYX9_9GAMM|nr:DUF2235 domain-containing protein [Morganella psychrotolerans]KAA8713588.1 DUF2235 domain-containing protein [Morganella psychrotolerans]